MSPTNFHRAVSVFVFFITICASHISSADVTLAASELLTAGDKPNIDPQGDDLIPWPWGSECSFPWDEIGGRYRVTRPNAGAFNGHSLDFQANLAADGEEDLTIRQFNNRGREIATGTGHTLKDKRLVRGIMEVTSTKQRYTIIVRSYPKDKKTKCENVETALVVSFCSLKGRKCLETDSYELIRRPPRNTRP